MDLDLVCKLVSVVPEYRVVSASSGALDSSRTFRLAVPQVTDGA